MPKGIYKRTKKQNRKISKTFKRKKLKPPKINELSFEKQKKLKKERSERQKGDKNIAKKPEIRKKISKALKGRIFSDKWKEKLSLNHANFKGKNSPRYKGGYERKLYLNRRRRIKKLNAEGSHTFGEWKLLKRQHGYCCPACRRCEPKIKLTEDHIIPLSKGGSDYIENIQPLCKGCNSEKHTKIIKYEDVKNLHTAKS